VLGTLPLRTTQLRRVREQLGDERLGGLAHLRNLDRKLPLRGLHPPRAIAAPQPAPIVAKAALIVGPALIARAAEPGVELVLDRALDDQPRSSVAGSDNDSRGFAPTPTASSSSIWSSISADGGTVLLTA